MAHLKSVWKQSLHRSLMQQSRHGGRCWKKSRPVRWPKRSAASKRRSSSPNYSQHIRIIPGMYGGIYQAPPFLCSQSN